MADFPVDGLRVRDEFVPQRDDTVVHMKVARFYLGVHGPFVERIKADDAWQSDLSSRIEQLRAALRTLPT